jgi:hypothetical protein
MKLLKTEFDGKAEGWGLVEITPVLPKPVPPFPQNVLLHPPHKDLIQNNHK